MSSNSICQCDFRIKLAHLRDDFTRLQSELIRRRNAQTLEERHRLDTKVLSTFTYDFNEFMQEDILQIWFSVQKQKNFFCNFAFHLLLIISDKWTASKQIRID